MGGSVVLCYINQPLSRELLSVGHFQITIVQRSRLQLQTRISGHGLQGMQTTHPRKGYSRYQIIREWDSYRA